MIPDDSESIPRGTKIILKLKDDMQEYLEERRLKDLVKKHSEFISFPIELQVEKSTEREVTDSDDDEEDKKNNEEEDKKDELDANLLAARITAEGHKGPRPRR